MSMRTRLRAAALALGLAVSSLTLATFPATTAHAASCTGAWTQEWAAGRFYHYELDGTKAYVGQVTEEWNPTCQNVRAHFQWSPAFRTQGHPGVTGAWINVTLSSKAGLRDDSQYIGSLQATDVYSPSYNGRSIWGDSTIVWTAYAELLLTMSTGNAWYCLGAYADTHDYHGYNLGGAHDYVC